MIVVINSLGGLVSIQDEDLFQGSTKLNKIDLVAPFADNVVFKANFEMPDGSIKPDDLDGYLFQPSMKVIDKLNVWKLPITFPITQDYGVVVMQLRGYIGDTVVCTTSIKLPIQKGVPYSSDFEELSDKDQLLQMISDLRALLNSKVDKVNYTFNKVDNITSESVGVYFKYDDINEEYVSITLPQEYEENTEYYEATGITRITNKDNNLFLEYVDNTSGQSTKLEVLKDKVTINGKQVVVFDNLKARNITYDNSNSKMEAENVQQAIDEIHNNVVSLETETQENLTNAVDEINNNITKVATRVENVNLSLTNKINKDISDLSNQVVKVDTDKLLNYYLKNEVNELLSKVGSFKVEIVEMLPTEDISENTLYLVLAYDGSGNNYYEEYLYVNGRWELIGTTQISLDDFYDKPTIDSLLLTTHKQILLGADGVIEENVYNFTVESPDSYIEYRTNGTKFLVDLHLPVVGDLDLSKQVAITFGDTVYYVYNILKGHEIVTIRDLRQVNKYNNATGYRFIVEMTFFENSDITGFAIIPTVSISDVLSLTSDEMDSYMAEGGLTQGQLAICKKVITNGYTEGGLYRFDITYPDTYTWTYIGGGVKLSDLPTIEEIPDDEEE